MSGRKGHRGQLDAQIAERKLQALELRKSGASYSQIASRLGISIAQASRDVNNTLKDLAKQREEQAEQLRELEAARYDRLQMAVWARAVNSNSPDFQAITVVLKIMQQRAQLFGLNEAVKHELSILIDIAPTLLRLIDVLTNAGLSPADVFERMIQRVQAERVTANADHDHD